MAVNGSTLTDVAYIIKNTFTREAPINLAARNHPFFQDVRKVAGFTGSQLECPVQIGNVQGVSNTFAQAKTSSKAHSGVRWALTRAPKYAYHEIEAETLYATGDDKGAFVREVTMATRSMIEEWGNQYAFDLYGDGTGLLGTVGSLATDTVTLANPDDILKFEVGMTIDVFIAASTSRGQAVIESVDEEAGTFTFETGTTPGGTIATDELYVHGSKDNAISGLQAWIPDAAPGATLFFGVNRTVHPTRLAGYRVAATTADLSEALMDLAAKIHRRKGRPDRVYMAPTTFTALAKVMDAKIMREDGGDASFGREFIYLATPAGVLKCMPDADCDPSRAYMLQLSSWEVRHLLPLPHMVDDDGQIRLRLINDDGIEMRARGWSQLVCKAPGYNGVVTGL